MSLINSDVIPASATASYYDYTIDQSLRFNDDDSAYLSRTPSSAGNRRTWTWSAWVKKATNSFQTLFSARTTSSSSDICYIGFNSTTQELFFVSDNGVGYVKSTALYRDTTSHYHICVSVDTTQATASNRVKLYINGSQLTDLSQSTYPAQNLDTAINNTIAHSVGRRNHTSDLAYFDGYMAEVNFIDGQALDPTYFGETGDYGEWKPIEYTGTYGNNGFYLNFSDSGSIGTDSSGNGNNWTANNLSYYDVVPDSPTNNFATLNSLIDNASYSSPYAFYGGDLSEGNLKFAPTTISNGSAANTGTIAMPEGSGKWYIEWNHPYINSQSTKTGIQDVDDPYVDAGSKATSYALGTQASGTDYWYTRNNGTDTNTVTETLSTATVWSMAYDSDNGKIWFAKNGTWINSGNPATGTNPTYSGITGTKEFIAGGYYYNNMYQTTVVNFGQDSSFAGNKTAQGNTDSNSIGDFYYTPPSGYLALCTANLPDPAVIPSENFNTLLYTGNATNGHSITGLGFQPDFTWIKQRGTADYHWLVDAVRGTPNTLFSNVTNAESSPSGGVQSLDSDGFTVGTEGGVNDNGGSFVSWNWKANGSGVSNTNGSITSTVSANQDAGFSIVSYTGNGSSGATIGHGLSSIPEMIIVKPRSTTGGWIVYHDGIDSTAPEDYYINMDETGARSDNVVAWNDTAPTSSVFSLGSSSVVNGSGTTTIAYCFHSVDGFSKFGSYTGNGSTDGTFVYTGFRPAFVIVKRTNSSGSWYISDNKRDTTNPLLAGLYADSPTQEDNVSTSLYIDYVSNGFKLRGTYTGSNASGSTYIYMCFSENPFKHTNAK